MLFLGKREKKSERKRIRKSFNKLFAFKHFSWWAWLYVRSNLWNYNAVLPWIWLRSNVKVRKKGSNIYKDSISINIWPNKIETSHIHTFTHAHRRSSNLQKPYVYVCVCMHIFFWEGWKGCDFAKFGPYNFGALNKWTKLKTILCMNFRRCQRNRYEHFFSLTKLIFFLAATA